MTFETFDQSDEETWPDHSWKKCFCLREPVFWGRIFLIETLFGRIPFEQHLCYTGSSLSHLSRYLALWGCLFEVSRPLYQSMLILDLGSKILEREIKHSTLTLTWVRHLSLLCLLYSGHCSVPTASTNNEAKHAETIQQWEKVSAEMGFTNWSAIWWPNQKASIWRFGLFQKIHLRGCSTVVPY